MSAVLIVIAFCSVVLVFFSSFKSVSFFFESMFIICNLCTILLYIYARYTSSCMYVTINTPECFIFKFYIVISVGFSIWDVHIEMTVFHSKEYGFVHGAWKKNLVHMSMFSWLDSIDSSNIRLCRTTNDCGIDLPYGLSMCVCARVCGIRTFVFKLLN